MEKVVDVAERHRADQLLGDVVDLDLRKLLGILRQLFEHLDRFEIPQKGAQLDVVAVDRFGRTSLDGFQVEQKLPQDVGTIEHDMLIQIFHLRLYFLARQFTASLKFDAAQLAKMADKIAIKTLKSWDLQNKTVP